MHSPSCRRGGLERCLHDFLIFIDCSRHVTRVIWSKSQASRQSFSYSSQVSQIKLTCHQSNSPTGRINMGRDSKSQFRSFITTTEVPLGKAFYPDSSSGAEASRCEL